ncbi:hypothetical protein ACX15_23545, partial [Vibrio parahaemolyticus]
MARSSLDLGRGAEGVVGRRRRDAPLQALGAVPGLGRGRLAAADALDDDEQEQQLGGAEHEGADRRNHVEVGELQVVVGDPSRHDGEADEVHREGRQVHADEAHPEVQLAEGLVVHVAGPLRQPVVGRGEDAED